jgi:hypothetical protein
LDESDIIGDVPMIIGRTLNELVTAIRHPERLRMTEAEKLINR